ncbi:MAG: VOC family protein [Hyphomicrobiaceae bacterium]|nr:MAG: VOC family protein [Hyphomicrobiaceae bacterium]
MADDFSIDAGEPRAPEGAAELTLTRRLFLPTFVTALASSAVAAAGLSAQAKQQASSSDVGTIWWHELRTRNPAKAKAFYSGVVGWTPKVVAQEDTSRPPNPGEKDYVVFAVGEQDVAGAETINGTDTADVRPGWLTYIHVDDVDEASKWAVQLGGKVVQEPFDAPGVGRMAEIEDPEGNRVGLVSPRL